MQHSLSRARLAVPGAIVLSLVLAGQALAHTWSAAIPITNSGDGFGEGVVGLNSTTAVLAYVEFNGSGYSVNVRRSTTSGDSWSSPHLLTTDGYPAAIAGLDPFVDIVWVSGNQVTYVRSIDEGQNFSTPMGISTGGFPLDLSVARGDSGLVIVAWQNGNTNAIKVRVSTNGGMSFGAISTFSSNIQDMGTAVTAGDGVVYLAYKTTYAKLRVRSSTDGGQTWSSALHVTNDGYGVFDQFALSASGTHAYLAYAVRNTYDSEWGSVRYRRTLDSGSTWSAQMDLAPPKWKTEDPSVALQGGVIRAAYARRMKTTHPVYYQQSTDGLNWTAAEEVAPVGWDPSVTRAGKIIVLYESGSGTVSFDAYVRTGT